MKYKIGKIEMRSMALNQITFYLHLEKSPFITINIKTIPQVEAEYLGLHLY